MKNIFHFAFLFLFFKIVLTQYLDGDYGNSAFEDAPNAEYPSENVENGYAEYPNDYPAYSPAEDTVYEQYPTYPEYLDDVGDQEFYPDDQNSEYLPIEYPDDSNYPENLNYPDYPKNDFASSGGADYPGDDYPQDPYHYPDDYPETNNGGDYLPDDYPYPEYPNYPEYEQKTYPSNDNYRNPGRQSSNSASSRNQKPSRGQSKPPSRKQDSDGNNKNEILEVLKQILHAQKGGNKAEKEKDSKKSDSSEKKFSIKDLLPYVKDIANGKEPDFGEIASKFGKNGLKEIQKFFGDGDNNVGGSIAKAGLDALQNLL